MSMVKDLTFSLTRRSLYTGYIQERSTHVFLLFLVQQEVFITTKVVSVNQSPPVQLPEEHKRHEVSEEVVTYVKAQDRHFEPQEIKVFLDDSQDSLDANGERGGPVIVELVREPVGLVRRKSGNKVKKRRSFRDKFAKRLSSGQ